MLQLSVPRKLRIEYPGAIYHACPAVAGIFSEGGCSIEATSARIFLRMIKTGGDFSARSQRLVQRLSGRCMRLTASPSDFRWQIGSRFRPHFLISAQAKNKLAKN